MISEPAALARVNNEAWIVRLFVVVLVIDGKHLAHVDAKAFGENLIRRTHRRVVGDQKQIASAFYPIAYRVALLSRECRVRCLSHVHPFCAERV